MSPWGAIGDPRGTSRLAHDCNSTVATCRPWLIVSSHLTKSYEDAAAYASGLRQRVVMIMIMIMICSYYKSSVTNLGNPIGDSRVQGIRYKVLI